MGRGVPQNGFFMAKCDVFEIPLDELHAALPAFERHLRSKVSESTPSTARKTFPECWSAKHFVNDSGGFHEKGDFSGALGEENRRFCRTPTVWGHTCPSGSPERGRLHDPHKNIQQNYFELRTWGGPEILPEGIFPTTWTAATSAFASPLCMQTSKPSDARASKFLCTLTPETNFRTNKRTICEVVH